MRSARLAASVAIFVVVPFAAIAGHDHYIDTPGHLNTDLGKGQTAIDDETHGGYHKIHDNVHTGTPGTGGTPSGAGPEDVGTERPRNPVTIGKTSDLD